MSWLPFGIAVACWSLLIVVQMVSNNRFLRAFRQERMAMHALHDQIEAQLQRFIRL